ncbi:hypothetical protein BC628DRAFT_1053892 [Trametes gibbosa]|nr:hypothetical protein BC628DRAFT_1053892 [Trametes gibbosa]
MGSQMDRRCRSRMLTPAPSHSPSVVSPRSLLGPATVVRPRPPLPSDSRPTDGLASVSAGRGTPFPFPRPASAHVDQRACMSQHQSDQHCQCLAAVPFSPPRSLRRQSRKRDRESRKADGYIAICSRSRQKLNGARGVPSPPYVLPCPPVLPSSGCGPCPPTPVSVPAEYIGPSNIDYS